MQIKAEKDMTLDEIIKLEPKVESILREVKRSNGPNKWRQWLRSRP